MNKIRKDKVLEYSTREIIENEEGNKFCSITELVNCKNGFTVSTYIWNFYNKAGEHILRYITTYTSDNDYDAIASYIAAYKETVEGTAKSMEIKFDNCEQVSEIKANGVAKGVRAGDIERKADEIILLTNKLFEKGNMLYRNQILRSNMNEE